MCTSAFKHGGPLLSEGHAQMCLPESFCNHYGVPLS